MLNFNLMVIPTLMFAFLLFGAGTWLWKRLDAGKPVVKAAALVAAAALAVPAAVFVLYYTHTFDDAVWYYRFRAAPYAELAASLSGLFAGMLYAVARSSTAVGKYISGGVLVFLMFAGIMIPHIKPIIAPLNIGGMEDLRRDGVCLQSTGSTCGSCSSSTLLRRFGYDVAEKQVAWEAHSSGTGTENWYLARVFRRRGLKTEFIITKNTKRDQIPYPSIAGVVVNVQNGGFGHFIAVLDKEGVEYIIGDPLFGKMRVPENQIGGKFVFTGFFLKVSK